MLKIFTLLLLLFGRRSAFQLPDIYSDELVIQKNAVIGKFVELEEKDTLVLKCNGRFDDLDFHLPNNSDHEGYNKNDVEERANESFDEYSRDLVLVMSNLKQSDTGSYACRSETHPSLNDTVYVFVKGSSAFVPLKTAGFIYKVGESVIPCKATSHFEKADIELYVKGDRIKEARKAYNHKYGFQLNNKMYHAKQFSQVQFECKYTGSPESTVSYVISADDKDAPEENDLQLYWVESTEWPYVDGNFSINCALSYNGTESFHYYKNSLHVTCPQCSSNADGHAVADRDRRVGNTINANIKINSLKPEDSGDYVCIWKMEGRDEDKVLTKTIKVSPKKSQIRIIERSSEKVVVQKGDSIELFAKIAVYPFEKNAYKATWRRQYTSPIKNEIEKESIINDNNRVITNDFNNFEFSEKLVIDRRIVDTDLSGTYILEVVHNDTFKNIEWQVAVKSSTIKTKISIREPSSFVFFDQPFHPPNTHLHIDCITESLPPAEVTIKMRKLHDNKPFLDVDPAELHVAGGTFESGYIWNATIDEDIEVQCIGKLYDKQDVVTRKIRIADREPDVVRKIIKSATATSLENPKLIYEGDDVVLDCIVPHEEDWTVEWLLAGKTLKSEQREEGHSRHTVLTLENVISSDSGTYTCRVENEGKENELNQTINVGTVLKPYNSIDGKDNPVNLQYGESAKFNCNLIGDPNPDYEWFKDGKKFTHGEVNNLTMMIPHVSHDDEGVFSCRATNRAGTTEQKFKSNIRGAPTSYLAEFIVVIFILIIVLIGFGAAIFYFQRQKNNDIEHLKALYDELTKRQYPAVTEEMSKVPIDQRVQSLPCREDNDIDLSQLEIGPMLGHGTFGKVQRGYLRKAVPTSEEEQHAKLAVAIKSPLVGYSLEQNRMLAEELKIMNAIGHHPNLVTLIGATLQNMRSGHLNIVLELCTLGDLRGYLIKHQNKFINQLKTGPVTAETDYLQPNSSFVQDHYETEPNGTAETQQLLNTTDGFLTTTDLVSFSYQIANGMEYLASVPCVHRDLAARNILLTGNKIVRVADFGLAKEHCGKQYYRTSRANHEKAKLPIRWMSPEAMSDGKYTEESDVWSYGITLYEIFTLGKKPYPSVPDEQTIQIRDLLLEGLKNPKPDFCHKDIYELMLTCWAQEPEKRRNFSHCVKVFREHMDLASSELAKTLEIELSRESEKQQQYSKWLERPVEVQDPRVLVQSLLPRRSSEQDRYRSQGFPMKEI